MAGDRWRKRIGSGVRVEGALWVKRPQRREESGRIYQLLPAGLQVSCQVAHVGVLSMCCVLLRVQSEQVAVGGNPRVRWRSTAFDGEVEAAALVTLSVWGPGGRVAGHECAPITFLPLSSGGQVRLWKDRWEAEGGLSVVRGWWVGGNCRTTFDSDLRN